jgi:hypothetical protein
MRRRLRGLATRVAALPRPRPPAWQVVVVFVAILTWPVNTSPPTSGGFDISWITALAVAAGRGLHFGSQINYTYGPLGYLTIGNIYYDQTGIPADFVIGALYVGMLALLARPICRTLGIAAGGLLVFVLARLAATPVDPVELLMPLMVALTIIALRRDDELPVKYAIGISLLAGFSALDKLSGGPVGVAVVVVLAIVAATRPGISRRERVRAAGTLLGSFSAGLVLLWLLAGQSLFDLPAYVRNSTDIITGYNNAVALSDPAIDWQYPWAAVCIVVVLGIAFWRDRRLPRMQLAGVVVLWLLFTWIEFRHAFVRLAPGHAVLFFGAMALLSGAVLISRHRWRSGLVACLLPLAVTWQVGFLGDVPTLFSVGTTGFVAQVNVLLSPNLRHAAQTQSAKGLAASYGFTPALIAAMSGQTVHFDPWEASIAYAYPQIRWDPAPVFQSYVAYTSHLDDLNADFLAGPRAPRYVLRENVALDGRDPRFESPRYMLELMCRYEQVMTTPQWQLLERGPNRCGAPVPIGSQQAKFDQKVFVPAPTNDSIVVASFTDFSQPLTDTLAKLLFKPPIEYISVNESVFRFVPGHASNPHVMSVPACLGWSSRLFDSTPYPWIGIGHLPQLTTAGATESSTYRVSFARIPFRCKP